MSEPSITSRDVPSTKPGSLLKSQIPVRTWADWDDARPGFVEIDLVSHDGGNAAGQFAFTLTVTDIAHLRSLLAHARAEPA